MERGGEEGGGENAEMEARRRRRGGEEEERWEGLGGGEDFEKEEGRGDGEETGSLLHPGLPIADWIHHRFRCFSDSKPPTSSKIYTIICSL